MTTQHALRDSVDQTQQTIQARFDTASAMVRMPGQPRKGYERTDTFLAAASKHLNAVEAVLVPAAGKHLDSSHDLVKSYVHASKGLELALAQAKAREYGSAYAVNRKWEDVWADVEHQLEVQQSAESDLVRRLEDELADDALHDLTLRLYQAEVDAPTRPHPYAPHTGVAGMVARRLLHTVDSFWDTVEGRMIPEPHRPPHKPPGKVAQYFLADPRFGEEPTPEPEQT